MRIWTAAIVAFGLAVPAAAQVEVDDARQRLAHKLAMERDQLAGQMRERVAVESRTTKGAPYSAEAVTESTQTLADGNRIVRKSISRIYRDSEGRTRREDLDESGTVHMVSIVDPVASTTIMLDPDTRTAYRQGRTFMIEDRMPEGAKARTAADPPPPPPPPPPSPMAPPPPPPPAPPQPGVRVMMNKIAGQTVREDLGRQTLEGLPATGSRLTTTIAAGTIGNDQPIKVVAEQWLSPDLQVLVMTKHSDPRQGETTYRLLNIVRAEPDRSLFQVPADYTSGEPRIRRTPESRQ